MISKENITTLISRSLLLALSFIVVVITSRLWGAEGRGEITLVMADIALILIISNIASSGGVSYYLPHFGMTKLLFPAVAFGIILSTAGALIFAFLHGFQYFFYLIVLSILNTLTNIIIAFAIGRRKILLYNTMLVIPVVLTLAILLALYFIFDITDIKSYFIALGLTHALILLVAISGYMVSRKKKSFSFDIELSKKVFSYGFKNELSAFLNLLNSRLSYYIIARLLGLKILGVYSVAIALAEAFWIISKSLSIVQYSTIINQKDNLKNVQLTKHNVKLTLLFTTCAIVLFVICPSRLITFIFGDDFEGIKRITLILVPGVLSIAASNLYGHYFSATGKMKVLINKSLAGLATTLIFALILIPRYNLIGACIATNISLIVSSTYLFVAFQREQKRKITLGKKDEAIPLEE